MNDTQQPMVSVVMPSFNQANYLQEAVESVLQQDWRNLELLVQDGGSTDGSLDILASLAAKDCRLNWVSAPDRGPADAINQALRRADGTLIGWLNSDDRYAPGAIRQAATALQGNPQLLLLYGEGLHIDQHGQPIGPYPTVPDVPPAETFQEGCFICQPTVFFKRVVTILLGPLDEQLNTAFDFEYWVRAFRAFHERIGYLPEVLAHSRLHADCITRNQRREVALEGLQLLARHFGKARGHWLISYLDEALEAAENSEKAEQLAREALELLDRAKGLLEPMDFTKTQNQLQQRLRTIQNASQP